MPRKIGYCYRRNAVSFPVCVYTRACMSNEREGVTVTVELVGSFPFHFVYGRSWINFLRCSTLSPALGVRVEVHSLLFIRVARELWLPSAADA